jgi:hypothetical protein
MTDFRMAGFHAAVEFLAGLFPAAVSIPARSAASTMGASRMRFPGAGMQVSAEGFMEEEAFMLEEAFTDEHDASDTGKSTKNATHAQKGATHALHWWPAGPPRIDGEQAKACATGDGHDV